MIGREYLSKFSNSIKNNPPYGLSDIYPDEAVSPSFGEKRIVAYAPLLPVFLKKSGPDHRGQAYHKQVKRPKNQALQRVAVLVLYEQLVVAVRHKNKAAQRHVERHLAHESPPDAPLVSSRRSDKHKENKTQKVLQNTPGKLHQIEKQALSPLFFH